MAKSPAAEPRTIKQQTADECEVAVAAVIDMLDEEECCGLIYPPALPKKPCIVVVFRNGKQLRILASQVPLKRAEKMCKSYNREAKGGPFVAAFIPQQVREGD